ncbi:DUF2490 domain-containing protein [Algoriphagus confluentis]|uniref:DUF2490 domain-containing protein n=1 Tax=Algoriphagus confluentis TaxID=1697556 RepID=A0ABQ6PI24_9BACT|nr:hypothetical protein Aconfl_01650 [Algoriphagus confluentis]
MRKCLLIFTLIVLPFISSAQEAENLDNRILYTKWYLADFFNDSTKWAWELDVVYRRQSELGENDFWSNPLRYSVRPWIAYQFTKLTRVSLNPIGIFNSAPRFPLESDLDRPFERELRTTLQINNYANYGRFNFTHRLRFESRWRGIDNPEGVQHNFRFRYRIRLRTPLNTDYFYKNNTLYISNYHEVHVEFGRDYGTNYLSQNRNFVGLGYRFWDWTRVELGYIYQFNTRSNNTQVDVSRGPMFYLFLDVLSRNQRKYKYSF